MTAFATPATECNILHTHTHARKTQYSLTVKKTQKE